MPFKELHSESFDYYAETIVKPSFPDMTRGQLEAIVITLRKEKEILERELKAAELAKKE